MDDGSGDYDDEESQYLPHNWAIYLGVILGVVVLFYIIEPRLTAYCRKRPPRQESSPIGVLDRMTLGSLPNDEDSATDGLELSLIEEGKMD